MANPVATMTARVQIDKQFVMDDFLKDIKDIQKVADGNAIVYKLKANKDSLKDVLKQIQNSDLQMGVDVVIKAKSKDIQAQIDHLFKETPTLNVETKVDTESIKELDNQIDSVSKSIDAAKKKLSEMGNGMTIDSVKKKMKEVADAITALEKKPNFSEKAYDKKVQELLDLEKTLHGLGGSLSAKRNTEARIQGLANNLKDNYANYEAKSLIADPSEIKEQENLIESLTNQLAELTAQKEKMAQAGMSASNGEKLADSLNKESAEIKDAASNLEKATGELEQASNKYDDILNKSYATSGKREATSQLKAAYEEYMKFFNTDNGLEKDAIIRNMSDAGREAAYSYYKALEEALRQGISQNSLEKYFAPDIDDRVISKNLTDESRLEELKYNFSEFTAFIQEQARIAREVQFVDTEQAREALSIYMDAWDLWRARSDNFTDLESTKDEQEWTESAKKNLIEVVALEKELIAQGKQSAPINEEFTVSTEKAKETAEETTDKVEKEAEAFKEAGEAAEKAAEQKEKFANANNEAAQSGEKTEAQTKDNTSSIKEENKALEENIDLIKMLDKLQGIKSKFNLGSEFERAMNAEMDIADFQKIAPSIAAIYNEQNNTSVTVAQVVKAYKAAQKEMQKADMERLQQHLHNMEEQERKDNEVFQEQVNQYKKYIADTEEIRAHNESVRNDNALQDAMNLARIEQEEQRQFLADLNKYEDTLRADIKKYNDDWDAAIKENQKFDAERAKEQAERAKLPIDVQKELTSLDKVIAKYEQYSSVSKEATEAIKKLKDARTNLKIHSDRDTLSNVANVRELNSNILESLVTNKDLVKSSALDAVNRKIDELGNSILNDTRLFDKFDTEVIQLESDLQKVGTNAGLEQIKTRVEKLTESIKEESKAIKQADSAQEKINKDAESSAIKDLDDWNKRATASYKELTGVAQRYYDLQIAYEKGTITQTELEYLNKLEAEWKEAAQAVGKYQTATGSSGKTESDLINARNKFNESDVAIAMKFAQALSKSEEKLRTMASSGKYTTELSVDLKKVADEISAINGKPIDLKVDGTIKSLAKVQERIDEVLDNTKIADYKKAAETSIAKLNLKIEKFMQDNSAMGAKFREQFENLKLDWDTEHSYTELQRITEEFVKLETKVEAAKKTGKSFFDTLRQRATGLNAQLVAYYLSWQDWIRYARTAIETIKELDYELIDLKKTTTMSSDELKEFYFSANVTSKEMGVTTKEIISQAAAWSRLGYSSKEAATEMAALSSQFAQISPGMDVETATDGLVSAMKAFHVDVTDVESEIMDVINKTGNTMATTNEEIVDMLERSSSAMSAANNTIKETIALESAAVQITRNAETTGTAFRTISMRIRGYDEETEEYIGDIEELTGKIADLTKTASTPGGISLFTDETKSTYKSTYQILKEISSIYNDLSDKNQAELLETLAGKRGGQVLAGILQDFSEVERAMKNMEEAAGSADAEMGIVEESIQYKLNNLQQTWIGVVQELIDNGSLGKAIDALTSISVLLGEIITAIGPLPSVIAGIGLTQLLLHLDSLPKKLSLVVEGIQLFTGGAGSLTEVLAMMFPNLTKLVGLLAPIAPYILAIAAASAAIYGIYKIWDTLTISVEEANEALKEFSDKYDAAASEIEKHQKAIVSLSDSYFELAKGVDSVTGKNISLSDTDYKEFVETNQKLAELFPQLITGVDEYGNYILDLGSNAEEAKGKLESLLKQEQDNYNYELFKDLPEVSKNVDVKVADANKRIETAKSELDAYNQIYDKLNDIVDASGNLSESFTLVGDATNEEMTKTINDFVMAYQGMVDDLALTNPEMASNIRRALQDESVGEEIKKVFHVENLSDDEKRAISSFVDQYVKEVSSDYKVRIADAKKEISAGQAELSSAWLSMQKNLIGGINFLADDEKTANVLTNFVQSMGTDFAKELEGVDLQSTIVDWISQVDQLSDLQKIQFEQLINGDMTPQERIQLYDRLRSNLPDSFNIPIHFIADEAQGLIDRVKASKSRLSKSTNSFGIEEVNPNTISKLNAFFDEMQIDTEEEYNLWLQVTEGVDSATDAMEAYRDAVKEVNATTQTVAATNIDTVTGINTRLKSQFDSLEKIYQSVFTSDGFDKNGIDNDVLKDFTDNFVTEATKLGVAEDKAKESAEEFIKAMTDPDLNETKAQDAINKIATSYFYAADGLKELNEETANAIKRQLEGLNIINADEIVDYYINIKANTPTKEEAKAALAEYGIEDPTNHQIDYYISFHAKNGNLANTMQSTIDEMEKLGAGGGVDLMLRPKVDTAELNKVGWEAGEGVATVFSSTFSNKTGDLALNFTPILTNRDGTLDRVLSPEELEKYAMGVIEGVHSDYLNLQIGAEFTGEDAIEEAIKAAEKIHELQDIVYNVNYDTVVGNIENDIDGVWEDYNSGAIKADELTRNLQATAESGIATEDLEYYATVLGTTTEELANFLFQEALVNSSEIDTTQECAALLALAGDAQTTEEVYQKLLELLEIYANIESDVYGQGTQDRAMALARAAQIKQEIDNLVAADNEKEVEVKVKAPSTKSSSGAGKEAGDAYVEAFEKELEALEKQRDAGLISESEFLEKYRDLIERYFKDVDGYGEEYAERMADYWDKLISHMDNVVSAIGKLLDRKKDAAEKGKEAAVKALQEEQKAAEKNYQDQIDYIDGLIDALEDEKDALQDQIDVLNDQIDAINDANTAREHSMALQKAQYELERSMSQRTKLVYTGEVGQMRYERDESAVRSAQEDVKDAEDQLAIDAIEKQIKLLEEQQDLIDKQIQTYKDQQEALQDMLDKSNEYYESLIEQTETYWDSLIEAIDNQKSKWDELVEQKEIAEAFALVQDAMRSLGYTVEDVLNDTPGAFEAFRDAYLNALSDANSNNQDFLDGLQYATNSAKGAFSEISSSAGDIKDALGEVADATAPLADAATNITNMGSAASTASSGMGSLKTATDGIASDVTELNNVKFDGLAKALDDVKKDIEGISNLLIGPTDSIESALTKLNDETVLAQLGQAFEKLSESISSVAGMLGAGGGNKEDTDASSESMGGDAGQGSTEGSGLANAIQKVKEAADQFIGQSVDDENETAIGRFNLLKSAIKTLVDEVIGNTEIEGTLIGSINSLPQVTEEALMGDEGAIAKFNLFNEALEKCATAASTLLDKISGMSGLTLPSFEGGEGVEPNFQGTAKYTGDWSVGKNEKALMGELGPEAVLRDGKYTLVGKNGPEFVNLKKDDIVLNHLQTAAILDKKNQIRTLADGTVLTPIDRKTFSLTNGLPTFSEIRNLVNDQTKAIQESISKITTINNEPKVTINNPSFTVSGVTGEEVMRKIEGSFEGLMLNAYQKAMS